MKRSSKFAVTSLKSNLRFLWVLVCVFIQQNDFHQSCLLSIMACFEANNLEKLKDKMKHKCSSYLLQAFSEGRIQASWCSMEEYKRLSLLYGLTALTCCNFMSTQTVTVIKFILRHELQVKAIDTDYRPTICVMLSQLQMVDLVFRRKMKIWINFKGTSRLAGEGGLLGLLRGIMYLFNEGHKEAGEIFACYILHIDGKFLRFLRIMDYEVPPGYIHSICNKLFYWAYNEFVRSEPVEEFKLEMDEIKALYSKMLPDWRLTFRSLLLKLLMEKSELRDTTIFIIYTVVYIDRTAKWVDGKDFVDRLVISFFNDDNNRASGLSCLTRFYQLPLFFERRNYEFLTILATHFICSPDKMVKLDAGRCFNFFLDRYDYPMLLGEYEHLYRLIQEADFQPYDQDIKRTRDNCMETLEIILRGL